MEMKNVLILTLLLFQFAVYAQKTSQAKTDSLMQVLQTNRQDTTRVKALNALAFDFLQKSEQDSAIAVASSALHLSKKINFSRGEADAHFYTAQAYGAKGNTTEALQHYENAAKLYEQAKYRRGLAEACYAMGMVYQRSNYDEALQLFKKALTAAQETTDKNLAGKTAYIIAVVYTRKGDYNEALPYNDFAIKYYLESGNETGLANCYVASARINYHRGNIRQSLKDNYAALRLFEKAGNKVGIYNVYTGLGQMYLEQKNYPEALNSYLASKKAAEEQDRKEVLAGAYNNIGNTYLEMGNTKEALKAFTESLKLAELVNDKKVMATSQGNLGIIYNQMGRTTEALNSHEQAIKLFEQIGAKESIGIAYMEIGRVYFNMKKPNESKEWLDKALQTSKALGDKDVISESYLLLTQIDTAVHDYASALEHYKLYITYRDSISNAEAAKHLIEERMLYAFSKKEDSLRLQQALIAEQLEKQTLFSKQQQQELRLKQAALELTQRERDVQMLTFLKTKAELQLSNEQKEKKLTLAEQQRELQQSQLEKQTLLSRQKEQALLLKERQLSVQRFQRNFWLAGVIALLLLSFFIFRNNRQKQKANVQLQQQKGETEKALNELKATQAQLIQREKMASLGELTAGIAHEIQNPLNFVNNFSAINRELVAEMKEELLNGQYEAAKALAAGIEENEQKISNHGQRASAIIKNMLEHSRGTAGEKLPTDINKLAEEYLWLAYHGMRARDKSFDTEIQTHYSNGVGKGDVVPQDLGRVLLNLYTNAFYAVSEKKNRLNGMYKPEVIVNTKRMNGKIEIHVKDNGGGIPQTALDKIFQPFFTTKPPGEGTGLGLSLSYDIITKGHGGDITVHTKEGEYSEFIIQLPA
jgi:signal transduction histidine kinase